MGKVQRPKSGFKPVSHFSPHKLEKSLKRAWRMQHPSGATMERGSSADHPAEQSTTDYKIPKFFTRLNVALMKGEITDIDAVRTIAEAGDAWFDFAQLIGGEKVEAKAALFSTDTTQSELPHAGYLGDLVVRHAELAPSSVCAGHYIGSLVAVELLAIPDSPEPVAYASVSLPEFLRNGSSVSSRAVFSLTE